MNYLQERKKRLLPLIDQPDTDRGRILLAMLEKQVVTVQWLKNESGVSAHKVGTNISGMVKNAKYLVINRTGVKGHYNYELLDILCPMSLSHCSAKWKPRKKRFNINSPFQRVFDMMSESNASV